MSHPYKMNSYIMLLHKINAETMHAHTIILTYSGATRDIFLAPVEARIADLTSQLPAARDTSVTSQWFDVEKAARDLAPSDVRWQKLVDDNMVENVQSVLHDCYDPLCEEYPKAARSIIGDRDSPTWNKFCFRVIKELKHGDAFATGDENVLDSFQDTAGGCDETIWDVACNIVQREYIKQ